MSYNSHLHFGLSGYPSMVDLEKVTNTFVSIHHYKCKFFTLWCHSDLLIPSPACSECGAKAFNIIKKERQYYPNNSLVPPLALPRRTEFESLFLVGKALNRLASDYISELLSSWNTVREMRSWPHSRSRSKCFTVTGLLRTQCISCLLSVCWLVGYVCTR